MKESEIRKRILELQILKAELPLILLPLYDQSIKTTEQLIKNAKDFFGKY